MILNALYKNMHIINVQIAYHRVLNQYVRPTKIKRFVCPFGLKLEGSVGRSLLFKILTQKKYNIIHVCEFLGCWACRASELV